MPGACPYETVTPVREGFVERDGVRSWYAQFGDSGPWLAFAPIFQIANAHALKGVVPYLSQHFRVVVMDLRGNGRSDRPTSPEAYSFDHYFADFVAVLDRLEVDRAALVGISATAQTVLRLAAEQPQRQGPTRRPTQPRLLPQLPPQRLRGVRRGLRQADGQPD